MIQKLFGRDKDDKREDIPDVNREDRRGTGDEAPEHAPGVFPDPEDAGHAPGAEAGARAGGRPADDAQRPPEGQTPHGRAAGQEMRDAGQGYMHPDDQRWFAGDGSRPDAPYRPDAPNHNAARDEGRSLEEEARILADNLIGQKPTAEGTAGSNWDEPPQRHPE